MRIEKKFMNLQQAKKKPDEMAFELFHLCDRKIKLWKTIYYVAIGVVIFVSLGLSYANMYLGGKEKYTEYLHGLTIWDMVIEVIQAALMVALPYKQWQKFELLSNQIASAYTTYSIDLSNNDKKTSQSKLMETLRLIISGCYKIDQEIARDSSDYFNSTCSNKK